MTTIRERVAAYLKQRRDGATLKAIAIDLELTPNAVYKALHSNPFIWVERWVHTPGLGGRPAAVYRIVPDDAPSPAVRRRSAA
jgi:predicted ArsR family transcriptional regulator